MNKLIFNISVNLWHETKTAEQIAEEIQDWNLLEFMQQCIRLNTDAITVGAFREEAMDHLYNLYKDTNLNLWA